MYMAAIVHALDIGGERVADGRLCQNSGVGRFAFATIPPMCNQYAPPSRQRVEDHFHASMQTDEIYRPGIGPWGRAPFVRQASDAREAVVGQWALIADNAKEAKSAARIVTNNARSESLASRPTFRGPWARGQRCLIPADSFLEPNWESGKNEWWRFRRADGAPWGLAGLWNTWIEPVSGELVDSYTMLTMNADAHALMRRMHKPDPKYGPHEQDKRSVVGIKKDDFGLWLSGTVEDAKALIRLAPVDIFDARPDRPQA